MKPCCIVCCAKSLCYMQPWPPTTKRCRDSKNTSLGLVKMFKDCLNQGAKVLSRKSTFCWTKIKRGKKQRMREKKKKNPHVSNNLNQYQKVSFRSCSNRVLLEIYHCYTCLLQGNNTESTIRLNAPQDRYSAMLAMLLEMQLREITEVKDTENINQLLSHVWEKCLPCLFPL